MVEMLQTIQRVHQILVEVEAVETTLVVRSLVNLEAVVL
jgi:hypothetical protein